MSRKSGILLPLSSLASKYGIGAFSKDAYSFIDFLKASHQSYWQMLPICPTSFGDSPYQSPSSFAGNPYFISLEALINDGLLTSSQCDACDFGSDEGYVDYEKLYKNRYPLLRKAFLKSNHKKTQKYLDFLSRHRHWLDDYALFMALKKHFDGAVWTAWDEDIKRRTPSAMEKYSKILADEIDFWKFVQYKFFCQWDALHAYAKKNKIELIGDIPIYTSFDSSDVWANTHLFKLDSALLPTHVAGCPPDGFSENGQLWGNPLYDWDEHKKTDFVWWRNRLLHSFYLFDAMRIDHFRGFDEYFQIPYGSKNAKVGKWEKGPGMSLFSALQDITKDKLVIAEDLGFITPSVKQLLTDTGFFGMKVLEFAFDSRDSSGSGQYLPHNYPKNCAVYTGTHDNQTLPDWLSTIPRSELFMVREYLCDFYTPKKELSFPLVCEALKSPANICIIPIQDYLGLGKEARINTPATFGTNWRWRLLGNSLDRSVIDKISSSTLRYGRGY